MRYSLKRALLSAVLLLSIGSASAQRQLSSGEITSLFNNKTAEAYHALLGYSFIAYYTEDGLIKGIRKGKYFSSRWSVNDKDEICVIYPSQRGPDKQCHVVLEDNGAFYLYRLDNGELQRDYTYTSFTAGNSNHF